MPAIAPSVQPPNGFSHRQTLALALVSALSWISFAALPYEVTVFVTGYGISLSTAGWLSSLELVMLALAASWVGRSIARRDKRMLTLLGLALALLASGACLLLRDFRLLLAARLVFGIGMGFIAAATNALPAYHPRPEKMYSYMMIGLALVFSLLMYATPAAMELHGNRGFFEVEMALIAALGPLAIFLPRGVDRVAPAPVTDAVGTPVGGVRVLIGLILFMVGQGACWAFADQAASSLGIHGTQLALAFTASALLSIAGALGATALGMRLGYKGALWIGYSLLVFTAIGMYCQSYEFVFVAGVLSLNAAGMFGLPYIQAIVAELDNSGRSSALSGAAINFGAAAGPATGAVLSVFPGLAPIGIATSAVFLLSLALVLSGARLIREKSIEEPLLA